MKRRQFLKGLAALPLAEVIFSAEMRAAATGPNPKAAKPDLASGADPAWVREVRRQMPVCLELAYLQTASFGASPSIVVERVRELLAAQMKGPAASPYGEELDEAENSCRPLLAEALAAHPEEIALTHNATEGINIVLWSIDWKSGDEIVIGNHEHPALMMPCYNLRDRFGVRYREAAVDVGEDVVANVLAQLSPRTRLVAMSHVSRRNGRAVPVRALADELHRRGIRLLLDAAQGAGNVAFDFAASGCDYYSFSGHKWLLGPKGTGGLLVRRQLLARTPVSFTGAHAQDSSDSSGNFQWHPDSRRYEYGTRAQFNFGGLAEVLRWRNSIGPAKIYQRIQDLSLQAAKAVRESGKFQLVSPVADGERSGIVVLRLPEGFSAATLAKKLEESDRIVVSPLENPRDLRASLHFHNTWSEFELLMARLNRYCA